VYSLRSNNLQISFAVIVLAVFAAVLAAVHAANPNEVVGIWTVENSTENHELEGVKSLAINADGTAIKSYESSKFTKKWSLSKGKLVFADVPGVTPGPPEEFFVDFADASMRQLRLKNSESKHAIEIRLIKGG